MKLPSRMRVLAVGAAGTPDALHIADAPTPQVKPGEVLIRVFAVGLNRADILQRQGKYPPPPGASPILGLEVAGEICALGQGVMRWKIGDRVMALLAGGGCAECVSVSEFHCLPVPDYFSMEEAAATPEAVTTVWANLFEAGGLKRGEIALIHGGSSGIGTFAIQMAAAFEALPVVTVSSEEKAEKCRELGAMLAVNYKTHDFVKEIFTFTKDRGVDVVLDMVGGEYLPRNIQVLTKNGRHVSIATQHGVKGELDIRTVMAKRLTITGSTLRGRDAAEKARLLREVEAQVLPQLLSGRVKPVVFQSFPLEKAGEAHKLMESGAHIGKIVLTV
jgi:putative PIG3 family NAD(P)H quinone oxidoreductase